MANTPVVVYDDTLTDIADAIRAKNGLQDTYTPSEMPAAITAIPSGGGVGIPREVSANGVYGFPTNDFTLSLPSEATALGVFSLTDAFRNCSSLISVDLGNITTINNYALYRAFEGCSNLRSVDLGSLTTISGSYPVYHAFYNCTNLVSVDLGSLTTVDGYSILGYIFYGCASLTSIDLSSLVTLSGGSAMEYAFQNCTSISTINFNSLATVSGGYIFNRAFQGCTSLRTVSFPSLLPEGITGTVTNQFEGMLSSCTNVTLHFKAEMQAKIETMTGYPNFSGTNTTVLFDL